MSDDYEVGFGKTPKHTRWKAGQSGNPKGRPKGSKNLKTELEEELQELISVREGGARRTISKQRAVLKGLTVRHQGKFRHWEPTDLPTGVRLVIDGVDMRIEGLEADTGS